jgi:hypothetical protein
MRRGGSSRAVEVSGSGIRQIHADGLRLPSRARTGRILGTASSATAPSLVNARAARHRRLGLVAVQHLELAVADLRCHEVPGADSPANVYAIREILGPISRHSRRLPRMAGLLVRAQLFVTAGDCVERWPIPRHRAPRIQPNPPHHRQWDESGLASQPLPRLLRRLTASALVWQGGFL